MGAWVEMILIPEPHKDGVAPRAGAWIEIPFLLLVGARLLNWSKSTSLANTPSIDWNSTSHATIWLKLVEI